MRISSRFVCVLAALALLATQAAAQSGPLYTEFETGPVRPLAKSPDGTKLFAVNIPDGRLEIFDIGGDGSLTAAGSVHVGLEPCAVAARTDSEVWVVNHLSDSVSIVDVSVTPARVTRTLLVGDEPRDIVFAAGNTKAFITTAHRGQYRVDPAIAAVPGAGDPQLTTAGVGRSDVWVFDATDPGSAFGGTPLKIVSLFGDTPRALAVGNDDNTVYAAVFHSGNQTTTVSEDIVRDGFTAATQGGGDGITTPLACQGGSNPGTACTSNADCTGGGTCPVLPGGAVPGGLPGPSTNHEGVLAPETGIIVKFDKTQGIWVDQFGRNWSNGVRFSLPDKDVFAIDATSLNETQNWTSVGTILFNMAVNPVSGKVYVSNTEANNLIRFEGPGVYGRTYGEDSTVNGKLALSRIAVLDSGSVGNCHLNSHIDYSVRPAPASVKDSSLATPTEMKVSGDGSTLYVAAFGSGKVGVFDTADLENCTTSPGSFDPTVESANYISVSGGGPAGLVLEEYGDADPSNDRLYVMTRFDNGISVVDPSTKTEVQHVTMFNPEPAPIVAGRPILYDAFHTSSNGEASCSSCHIFGDLDNLAWDLGNPDDDVASSPIDINLSIGADAEVNGGAAVNEFHPMKGPMTTQTLRGMQNHGGLHWRGDRTNGFFGLDSPYILNASDPNNPDDIADRGNERLSFRNFIVAFPGLVGDHREPTDVTLQADMDKFADFQMSVMLPPNPIRNLDNSLNGDVGNANTIDEMSGFEFFTGPRCSDGVCFGNAGFRCNGCHELKAKSGFFGAGGQASFENETQIIKVAHLRNMYTKVGMFGMPLGPFFNGNGAVPETFTSDPDSLYKGEQIRGFGFIHDGSTDTLFRFLQATVFDENANVGFNGPNGGNNNRRSVEMYLLAFDNDIAPVVGQQITLTDSNGATVGSRLDLLVQRASTPWAYKNYPQARECDLIATGTVDGEARSYYFDATTSEFVSDRVAETPLTDSALRAAIDTPEESITYTCYPPGAALRGVDRDLDGQFNRDELDAG
ncbi:MAG TPA: hypothetical protein VEB21_16590, partial [Terriglobales bacterium]|nr:hypothetical protein [Terriglobales bacterium]